jgi:Uma2 family endonuclease
MMPVQVTKRLFTVDEYHRMVSSGILTEEDRVELIDGVIVEMSAPSSRHAAWVDRLTARLTELIGGRAIVRVQGPMALGDRAEPQPDLALLLSRADFYAQGHPGPGDVVLAIEVSDTSVEYDRKVKVPLYARAGIPEVWQVSLPEDVIVVHRNPAEGAYRDVRRVGRGDLLSPEVFPDLRLSVDSLLG